MIVALVVAMVVDSTIRSMEHTILDVMSVAGTTAVAFATPATSPAMGSLTFVPLTCTVTTTAVTAVVMAMVLRDGRAHEDTS